jgi:ATP/maltotriose-dependent transcriptional regulator MalT
LVVRLDAPQRQSAKFRLPILVATSPQFLALRLSLLTSIGSLLIQSGNPAQGLETLQFVRHHPSSSDETSRRAQRLLEQFSGQTSLRPIQPEVLTDLERLTARLDVELLALERERDFGRSTAPPFLSLPQDQIEPLTPRERELLQLLAAGLSYQQIAEKLVIAIGSVKSHAHNIYAKLGVTNRMQAASRANELGLLQ